MRRWLLMFMLVLMPAQYTWAAVSAYCRHEGKQEAGAAGHLGHHEHLQAGADAAAGHDDGSAPDSSAKPECAKCHGPSMVMMPGFDARIHKPNVDPPRQAVLTPEPAHTPTPPERPKWPGLA